VGPVLILTDEPVSANRLARDLGGESVVFDLYDDAALPPEVRLVIADLHSPDSSSIVRLQRALAKARTATTPFLYLIHGSLERGEIQATMLGATRTLPATAAAAFLMNAVAHLSGEAPPERATSQVVQVENALLAFANIFTTETPTQQAVDEGTQLVDQAIRDMRVRDWLSLVAEFDDVTHRHCLSVAGLAAAFAHSLGLNQTNSHKLTKGALLHDIGKARVPLDILNKPGPLNAAERREMNKHPVYGYDMLAGRDFSDIVLKVVRSHHEMLDGSGYPDGLKADDIPDMVRLITVCDIFAALTERRPYKMPKSAGAAYQILTEMRGRLDQDLVRAFAPVAFSTEEDMQATG
jgi:putative nucleotidyltransferase with HDIG domain